MQLYRHCMEEISGSILHRCSLCSCHKRTATPREDDTVNEFPLCPSSHVMMRPLSACVLTLCLLMTSLLGGASVASTFRGCERFFYLQTPPAGTTGSSLRRICQRYANEARYATLYDGARRLPLYSAYVFKKTDGKKRMDTPWMYEPQVERLIITPSFQTD